MPPTPLAHVLWLGGPPDSGKTSLVDLLAARHGLQVYHFDRHEPAHLRRADPARQPALVALRHRLDTLDADAFAAWLWLSHTPAELAAMTTASWSERALMAREDLLAMPAAPPIIAEGPGFFPATIAPLLDDPRRVAYLLPTEPFKRASVARRAKLSSFPLRDLARARENLIQRDLLLGAQIRHDAAALHLPIHEIDGTRDLGAMADLLAAQFAPWLPPAR